MPTDWKDTAALTEEYKKREAWLLRWIADYKANQGYLAAGLDWISSTSRLDSINADLKRAQAEFSRGELAKAVSDVRTASDNAGYVSALPTVGQELADSAKALADKVPTASETLSTLKWVGIGIAVLGGIGLTIWLVKK